MSATLLGHAQTAAEKEAERHLSFVAEWAGRAVHYSPVVGGLQNSNWKIEVEGDSITYFLKVPGAGTEDFIDRGVANIAAQRAGELGISPRVMHFEPETGTEISEYLEGYRGCTNGDLKQWGITEGVIGLQDAFHSIESLPVTKTIFDMIDEHLRQAKDLGVQLPSFTQALLREYATARSALEASGLDLVPCHNDPMPGNFLVNPGHPMKLVDFEFASNNERAYDLAVMFTEFFYEEPTVMACIETAYGNTSWDVVSRVQVLSFLADVKWGLWGCVNHRLNTTWDYDYHKYGVWKLLRARAKMADSRWSQWLGVL